MLASIRLKARKALLGRDELGTTKQDASVPRRADNKPSGFGAGRIPGGRFGHRKRNRTTPFKSTLYLDQL